MSTFEDSRGAIRNVGKVAVIHSKAGSVRSNHYHRDGWHYLQVVSGLMRYRAKMIDGTEICDKLVQPGEMVLTGPLVMHRTEFPEDTVLISFQSEHDHDADLVKVEW